MDFRSHEPICAYAGGQLFRVKIIIMLCCEAKIYYLGVPLQVKHYVLQLQISVDIPLVVHVVNSIYQLFEEEPRKLLIKASCKVDDIEHLAASC